MIEFVFILDRSGSMTGLESDTIGGFNGMIERQKKDSEDVVVTTVLFDQEIETLHDRIPLADVPKMTERDYTTRGCTSLLDAIGMTIGHIKKVHSYIRKEDVPKKTIFVITTDGMENSSIEFDYKKVKKLITTQKEKGWEFLFLGANIDAFDEGRNLGIDDDRIMEYQANSAGIKENYAVMDTAIRYMAMEKEMPKNLRDLLDEEEEEE